MIKENLSDLGCGNNFLDTTLKALSMNGTSGKLDSLNKNFCSAKDTVKRIKS